jgi:hypothetical protein
MKRSVYVTGFGLLALTVASLFAPTPLTRTVQAQRGNSHQCEGLRIAYEACSASAADPSHCDHIAEQIAENCRNSSSSSR